jgi:hypothetical protein
MWGENHTNYDTMFASERIAQRFDKAVKVFLQETHNSVTAHTVVDCLMAEDGPARYGGDNRNQVVPQLAKDVEGRTGLSATLFFRSEGHLHDCLQTLLDAYLDAVDGIYYTETVPVVDPDMCLRH